LAGGKFFGGGGSGIERIEWGRSSTVAGCVSVRADRSRSGIHFWRNLVLTPRRKHSGRSGLLIQNVLLFFPFRFAPKAFGANRKGKKRLVGMALYPGRRPRRPCPGLSSRCPSGAPERRTLIKPARSIPIQYRGLADSIAVAIVVIFPGLHARRGHARRRRGLTHRGSLHRLAPTTRHRMGRRASLERAPRCGVRTGCRPLGAGFPAAQRQHCLVKRIFVS